MVILIAVVAGAIPAAAATTTSWATWQPLSGTGGAYTTSVQIADRPAITATMTTDSRAGQVGVVSGASVWLAQGTPVGAKYGSSAGQPYVNLRPKSDTATAPSTTTYTFAEPTPTSGWTFALGDIDADAVRITAIGTDGQGLTSMQLGFRGGFNYCAPGVAGKPSCTGSATDVPTWDAVNQTLTGNAAAADTSGSAAWFEPSAPITSLTFEFTRRSGFPVYQTWFASIARDITGTVIDQADGPLEGIALELTDANGTVVGTTTTAAGGGYSFPGFVATDGYIVRAVLPEGKIAVSPLRQTADLTDTDAVVDFAVRDIVPVAVSGRVVDGDGNPLTDVTVTVDDTRTTTTDTDGEYLFDEVAVGPHVVEVTPPPGYTIVDPVEPVVVPEDSEEPIVLDDVVVVENADLSGAVRIDGTGVAGVTVTAVRPDGTTLSTVTDANGGYTFPRLDDGEYRITVSAPDGYAVVGATTRNETVAGTDVQDVDFELTRVGAVSGVVRDDDGTPIPDVTITVSTDGDSQQVTTDADGGYRLGDLTPGTYTLTVTPPPGTEIVGPGVLTVEVTTAGESFVDQDFILAPIVVDPTDPPTPTPTPTATPTDPPGTGENHLPATGLGPETFGWAAAGGAVLLLGAVLLVVSRRRSRRD